MKQFYFGFRIRDKENCTTAVHSVSCSKMLTVNQLWACVFVQKNTISLFKALSRWLFIMFGIGLSFGVLAQKPDSTQRRTAAERDSIRYTNLRNSMKKRGITGELYNLLFRYPYNTNANQQIVNEIPKNPFLEYEGRVIRRIVIKRLDVFGPSVYDTLRKASIGVEKFGNKLHKNTREEVIRKSFLLFKEGESLEPQLVWDNERLLRQSPIFHDARIIVMPDARFPNIVDILVLTQDTWSLQPRSIQFGGFNNFGMIIEQKNRQGLAHTLYHGVFYNGNAPKGSRLEYTGGYLIPNIRKTFITGAAGIDLFRENKQVYARLFRPFLTPETKYAGNASMSYNNLKSYVIQTEPDTLYSVGIPLKYFYGDVWLGRAFKLNLGNQQLRDRGRLVIGIRGSRYHYFKRPDIKQDANRLYQNRSTYLLSLGFSNRLYRRDVLIYGFGRTEDVPYGWLASVVTGFEKNEFGKRDYYGLQLSKGQYLPKNHGYLYLLGNFGTFVRETHWEQGQLSLEANYFSSLFKIGRSDVRQFVNFRYATGIHRFNYEYLTLNDREGIRGLSSNYLIGTRKATLNLETVLFSPFQTFGFRIAAFGFADMGLISYSNKTLLASTLYQGYGIGFRFRNENLTFNTFSIRFGYYPTVPEGSIFRANFSGETPLRLQDFRFEEPGVVTFR